MNELLFAVNKLAPLRGLLNAHLERSEGGVSEFIDSLRLTESARLILD